MHCERCGETDFDNTQLDIIITGFGLRTALCYECNKRWDRFFHTNKLNREHIHLSFIFRCWQKRWRAHPGTDDDMKTGTALLQQLIELEERLYSISFAWIKTGITETERLEREERENRS